MINYRDESLNNVVKQFTTTPNTNSNILKYVYSIITQSANQSAPHMQITQAYKFTTQSNNGIYLYLRINMLHRTQIKPHYIYLQLNIY